jgi:hypothetical protein
MLELRDAVKIREEYTLEVLAAACICGCAYCIASYETCETKRCVARLIARSLSGISADHRILKWTFIIWPGIAFRIGFKQWVKIKIQDNIILFLIQFRIGIDFTSGFVQQVHYCFIRNLYKSTRCDRISALIRRNGYPVKRKYSYNCFLL